MAMHVKKKGDLSATFCRFADRAFEALPAFVLKALAEEGFKVVAGKELNTELHPKLTGYEHCAGFFAPTVKTIFLSQRHYSGVREKWMDIRSPRKTLFHEVGHFVDLFVMGTKQFPDGYRSDRVDFSKAYDADVKRIHKARPSLFDGAFANREDIHLFNKYFEARFVKNTTARHEVYAELWARMHAASILPVDMLELFPNCTGIVKEDLRNCKKASLKPSAETPSL